MTGMLSVFFFCLFVFWLAVAGISFQEIAVGLVAALFVFWLNRDMVSSLREKKGHLHIRKILSLAGYAMSLLWQIVLANIDVAKIVLNPRMPLQPTIVSFNPGLKTSLSKTILANSITLTPGTLTINVQGDVFTIHALTLAAAQSVVEWPLIAQLRRMEEDTV